VTRALPASKNVTEKKQKTIMIAQKSVNNCVQTDAMIAQKSVNNCVQTDANLLRQREKNNINEFTICNEDQISAEKKK